MNYQKIRAEAQARANRTGVDHGVEKLNGKFRYFMLPGKRFRTGHELRCEVVHPEDLSKCLPGHGPCA